MLTTPPTIATPLSVDTTPTAKAAAVEASARAAFRSELRVATDHEHGLADNAASVAAARRAASEVPDPMTSLSTVAVAGALNSLPAALNMMRNIALASAGGSLTEADRLALKTEYAQLSARVVGSVGAGDQAQTSTSRDDPRQNDAENTGREHGDDPRMTLTQAAQVPQQTVPYPPAQRAATVQRQALVAEDHPAQSDPHVDLRSHALHVGTDAYEPVSRRRSSAPAAGGRGQTPHSVVAQAAQLSQFVQVAQTEHLPPVVAVA